MTKSPRDTADPHDEEAEISAFLSDGLAFGTPEARVEIVETHAAKIFLVGPKALKLKKRVHYPFLDFTTLKARHHALARELELNRPHAPALYHRLIAITRETDGHLALDGQGRTIDWLLEMDRFDQGNVLQDVARQGPFPRALSQALAKMVARYHLAAPTRYDVEAALIVKDTLSPLLAALASAEGALDPARIETLSETCRTKLAALAPLLDQRAKAGAVRRCHGDLHLGNIVLIDGAPTAFDALEFDEALATTDVLYDLAFLLMDLVKRGQPLAANQVMNAYVSEAPLGHEIEGLATLPLFMAMRAEVRAIVALARAEQPGANKAQEIAAASSLIGLAEHFLAEAPPTLVCVGGFSGTGKTTLAASLAPTIGRLPGALHLRSDVERKRLFAVEETERLSPDHYTKDVSDEIYRIMLIKAAKALATGHSVIADAVFAHVDERAAFERLARDAGCAVVGLWLEAPADTLIDRVEARSGDASDADRSVVEKQLALRLGPMSWSRIDARTSPEETLARATRALASASGVAHS